MDSLPFKVVVILGAGRSGTNMLRDVICSLDDFATWPCDEIQAIWRHGNLSIDHDALPPERASAKVCRFIRGRFVDFWEKAGKPEYVVEKTCANTLRLPFVNKVLPEAKYIHIVRDGESVVPSAAKRWRGELEFPGLPYFFAKVRYVPVLDLPIFLYRFVSARIEKMLGGNGRLKTWGPRFENIDDFEDSPLAEVCAEQWVNCVSSVLESKDLLAVDSYFQLKYEDFVENPETCLKEILCYLGIDDIPEAELGRVAEGVRRPTRPVQRKTTENASVAAMLDPLRTTLGYN